MRTFFKLAAVATCVLSAPAALAAPTITSVSVTGPTGTVWNTTVDSYYAVFLQRPYGTTLNPNDNFTGSTLTNPEGSSFNYAIAGDGFPTAKASHVPSDPYYTLTLTLSEDGKTGTLSGIYTGATYLFTPSTTTGALKLDSGTYSLSDFSWTRSGANNVGAFSSTNTAPIGPGSTVDYLGSFSINRTAVPEPATWALMILGFGGVGMALRTRRSRKPAAAIA